MLLYQVLYKWPPECTKTRQNAQVGSISHNNIRKTGSILEMLTMSIVKSLEPLRAINWNDARPWIVMLGAVILFLGWDLRKKRREIQKLDLEIAQLRSQQSLVRVATIHEMNSLIKDVEEISARKLGNFRGREKAGAHFRAGREAVRMFLRGSFPCVFFLSIGVDRPKQYGTPLRNLWAVYGRFRPK